MRRQATEREEIEGENEKRENGKRKKREQGKRYPRDLLCYILQ